MDINSFLRKALLTGVFCIPVIPLIVATDPLLPNLFFPYITGKNFTFRILTELLVGGWLILMLRDATYRPHRSLITAAVAILVGIVAVADIFGVSSFKSIWSNFERMEGLVTMVHLLLYFLVTTSVLTTEKLWARFWQISLGVASIIGLYALFQTFGWFPMHQGDRPDSTLGNATYLGGYMLFHAFMAGYFFFRTRGTSLSWLYGGLGIFSVLIVYLTGTRGAILGVLGGAFLTAVLTAFFAEDAKRLRIIAAGAIAGLVILVGGFIAVRHTSFVQETPVLERLASISLEAGKSRLLVWQMAWQGFQDRPILGWGQENFNYVFNTYYDPQMYDQEAWFDRVDRKS